jgi:predicted nucleic acid-binding protein
MNVLIDTSVWSLALRRSPRNLSSAERALVAEFENLIKEGRAKIIGLIRQELLSGIKAHAQFEKLREIVSAFPDEPLHTADYEAAAVASNQCRGNGVAVTVSDMLICAAAQSRDWAIFSTDTDFSRYAKIISIKLHVIRPVPR